MQASLSWSVLGSPGLPREAATTPHEGAGLDRLWTARAEPTSAPFYELRHFRRVRGSVTRLPATVPAGKASSPAFDRARRGGSGAKPALPWYPNWLAGQSKVVRRPG